MENEEKKFDLDEIVDIWLQAYGVSAHAENKFKGHYFRISIEHRFEHFKTLVREVRGHGKEKEYLKLTTNKERIVHKCIPPKGYHKWDQWRSAAMKDLDNAITAVYNEQEIATRQTIYQEFKEVDVSKEKAHDEFELYVSKRVKDPEELEPYLDPEMAELLGLNKK